MIKKILSVVTFAIILSFALPEIAKAGWVTLDISMALSILSLGAFWVSFFLVEQKEAVLEDAPFYKRYRNEILFLVTCFFFYLTWMLIIPYNEAPDERMRYVIARYIFRHGTLPVGNESEIMNLVWGQSYAYQPILSYQIASLVMGIASAFGMASEKLFYAARFTNVVIATGTVAVALAIGKECFKGEVRFLFAGLIGLWPMVAFIGAYVNNDALAFFSAILIFYSWIVGRRRQWDLKACVLLAVGLSLCFLSYYNAYGFIFCSAFLYAGDYFLHRKEWSLQRFLGYGVTIVGICALLAGWWFVRSAILHDGDFLGLTACNNLAEATAQWAYKPSQHITPQNAGYSFYDMLRGPVLGAHGWVYSIAISILGVFGNFSIAMTLKAYLGLGVIALGGIFLFFVYFIKEMLGKQSIGQWLFDITCLMAIAIPIAICLYYSYTTDYQPQGRYIITALIPGLFLLTRAFGWLQEKIGNRFWGVTVVYGVLSIEILSTFSALCESLGTYLI